MNLCLSVRLGAQPNSMKPSQPCFKFGTATRDDVAKVYVSKEHDKLTSGRWSPGAIYQLPSSVRKGCSFSFGKAPRSSGRADRYTDSSVDLTFATVDNQKFKFRDARMILFGTSARDSIKDGAMLIHNPQAFYGRGSPGPTAYSPPVPVDRNCQPCYHFGMKTKVLASECQTPANVGPGIYPLPASVGPQADSTKPNLPCFKFARAPRQRQRELDQPVTALEAEKPSIGRQFSSKLPNAPQVPFGNASRAQWNRLAPVFSEKDKPIAHPPPRIQHPTLPLERDIVRYS